MVHWNFALHLNELLLFSSSTASQHWCGRVRVVMMWW